MDNATIAIIATAVLTIAGLLWTVLGWKNLYGARRVVRGVGLTLLPLGLWFSGIMELLVEGCRAVYRFVAQADMDAMMITGLSLLGLGVLLYVVGGFMKLVDRAEAKQRRLAANEKRRSQLGLPDQPSARTAGASTPAAASTTPRQANPALSDEDAEIEALLRKRGIE